MMKKLLRNRKSIFKLISTSILSIACMAGTTAIAQIYQFNLEGNATSLGNDSYRLTTNSTNQSGAIWSTQRIDLDHPFSICFDANFGNDNSGADGICFVLKEDSTDFLGSNGGHLGYASTNSITPSLVTEFDDFYNSSLGDITDDHSTVVMNADISNPLIPPVSLLSGNIEDGLDHTITIEWNPTTMTYSTWFDNNLVFQYNINPTDSIFLNGSEVFWGITSATGSQTNEHVVAFHPNNPFNIQSDASHLSNTCFELTPNSDYKKGAIWSSSTLDLNSDFNICFDAYFGDDDNGADGICFIIKEDSNQFIGDNGGYLGYSAANSTNEINPSLTVEFDDFHNSSLGDNITDDHVALVKNANISNPIVSPISLLGGNIEDGLYHKVRIQWEVNPQMYTVWFDNTLMFSHNIDIINDIFGGNPTVYWGITAATGNRHNQQVVCNINELCCISDPDTTTTQGCQLSEYDYYYLVSSDEGEESAQFNSIKAIENCKSIVAGHIPTYNYTTPLHSSIIPVISRLDDLGNPIYSYSFDNETPAIGSFENIIQLSDQNMAACGYYDEGNGKYGVVTKVDSLGNIFWSIKLPETSIIYDLEETPNREIVVTGEYNNNAFIILLDGFGTVIFQNQFEIPNANMKAFAVEAYDDNQDQIKDDGFVICGQFTMSNANITYGYILEIDVFGNPVLSSFKTVEATEFNDIKQVDVDGDGIEDPSSFATAGSSKRNNSMVVGIFSSSSDVVMEYEDNINRFLLRGIAIEQRSNGELTVSSDYYNTSREIVVAQISIMNNLIVANSISTQENEFVKSIDISDADYLYLAGGTDKDYIPNVWNPLVIVNNMNNQINCSNELSLIPRDLVLGQVPDLIMHQIDVQETTLRVNELDLTPVPFCSSGKRNFLDTESKSLTDLKLYPNPIAKGNNIQLETTLTGSVRLEITDLLGKSVSNSNSELLEGQSLTINTKHLDKGTYFLSIKNEQTTEYIQFIIQ